MIDVGTNWYTHDGAPTKNWRYSRANTLAEWAEANKVKVLLGGTSNFVAPIVWGNLVISNPSYLDEEVRLNYRCKQTFQRAGWVMLEFDTPAAPTYDEALGEFGRCNGFIHTSRSHQKPKGKEPACDRYHVGLMLDRPLSSADEYERAMMALQTLYPTNDKATLDAAHCFRCTSYTGRCDILTGPERIKVDELLQISREKKLQAAPIKPIDTTPIKTTGGKINPDAYTAIMTESWDFGRHTRDLIAEAAKLSYQICDSDIDTIATLEELDWIQDYIHDHSQHEFLDNVRFGIRRARQSASHLKTLDGDECRALVKPLSAKGQVFEVDSRTLPPINTTYMKEYCDLGDGGRVRFVMAPTEKDRYTMEAVAKTIDWQLSSECNIDHAILGVPCGGGKTVSARVYAAAMSAPNNQIWIATATKKAMHELQDIVESAHGKKTVLIAGFNEGDCTRTPKPTICEAYGKASPCKNCSDNRTCLYGVYSQHWTSVESAPIVITTHALIKTLMNKRKLPTEISLIIDEQFKREEDQTVPAGQWEAWARRLLSHNKAVSPRHAKLTMRLLQVFREQGWNNDVDNRIMLSIALMDQAKRIIGNTIIDKQGVAIDQTDRIDENSARHYIAHLRKLEDPKLDGLIEWVKYQTKHTGSIPVVTKAGTSYSFRKRALNDHWRNTKKLLILDGSAALNTDSWDGMRILEITDIPRRKYNNTEIIVLPCLPSRRNSLKRGAEILAEAERIMKSEVIVEPCLITNAETTTDEKEFLTRHPETIHIKRGSGERGSNLANGSDLCIITSSVFTSIADIALTTAVVTESSSITAGRIFGDDGAPKFSHGHLVDKELDDTMQRQMVDLIQQMSMRGEIRSDEKATYRIILSVSSWRTLAEIMLRVPPEKLTIMGDTGGRKLRIFAKLYNAAAMSEIDPDEGLTSAVLRLVGVKRVDTHGWREELGEMLGFCQNIL